MERPYAMEPHQDSGLSNHGSLQQNPSYLEILSRILSQLSHFEKKGTDKEAKKTFCRRNRLELQQQRKMAACPLTL